MSRRILLFGEQPQGTLIAVRDVVATAIIYLALGALGISFAIAPGYASPIFPAAGFAVAILLHSNNRVWSGIWLGSLALNLSITWLRGDLNWTSGLMAVGIACGSTTQALAGWWLVVRKLENGWRTLEAERDIFYCLTLAGPLAGIISASVGVTMLYAANVIPAQEILYAWLNWWSGDTLGIVVLLPISLALLYRRDSPWFSRLTTMVLPMLLALNVVGGVFYAVAQWECSQQKAVIQAHGETLADLLKQRFIAHQEVLASLQRLIEVVPGMSYPQFEYFTRISLHDNPDIFALSFNPYVPQAQREALERLMAEKTGMTTFEIKERDSQSRLIRAADRAYYVPVGYISPLEGSRPAVGYNINSDPIRRDAIQRAMRSDKPAITAPIKLVQENRQRVGVLLLLAASDNAATHGDRDVGNAGLMGFAVGVIKVDEMIDIATRNNRVAGLVFQVDDTQVSSGSGLLYRSEDTPSSPDGNYAWQTQVAIADRFWTLKLAPTADYLGRNQHVIALLVGTWGLMLAALLQVLLLLTTGRTSIFQGKVHEQTAELQVKSDILQDRNEQLSALFTLSPDGFVSFDRHQCVKYASPAFSQLVGLTNTQVIGLDETAFTHLLTNLCIPSARFRGIDALHDLTANESVAGKAPWDLIELADNGKVLQVASRRNKTGIGTVSQILYFHDMTRESEIDRMKSEFLSTAAHELRTPMASIYGFAELLLSQTFDEETQNELLGIIHRQSEVMIRIINELLDLARIEARRGKDFVYETLALEELLDQLLPDFKIPEGREAPVIIRATQPLFIDADRNKTLQAVVNLLSNAYKYSPGGGEVSIAILQEEDGNKTRVGIAVRDHGIGMTPEQRAQATERFYRADDSGTILGTGLGLSIVKEIVELQGGELSIASEFGVGTTMTLWFPLFEPSSEGVN